MSASKVTGYKKTASIPGIPVTPQQKAAFLAALARDGALIHAAREAGFSSRTAYNLRDADPEFAQGIEDARAEYLERLELEMDRRAYTGTDKPITYQGVITGTYKEYSDVLMMFRAKGLAPDKYRDNSKLEVGGPGGGPVSIKFVEPEPCPNPSK